MPVNDFQPFATGAGENVVSQATYLAALWRTQGFLAGLAESAQLNKVWRQGSFVAAALAQFISDTLDEDVLDNGDQAAFILQLQQALTIAAASRGARIVTASTTLNLLITDYAIGLNRTVGPAALVANLPAGPAVGQSFVIEDLAGNMSTYPVTVTPPAGTAIGNLPTFIMNEDLQSAEFRYYGSNLWSVRS